MPSPEPAPASGARPLPAAFLQRLGRLEAAYLGESDPIRQSGFSGGAARWHAERSPILDALGSGEILDIGCANGYLLECLVCWGRARGIHLTPYGLDRSLGLITLARQRLPRHTRHLYQGNAWDWEPPQRFSQVYSVWDCVPWIYFGAYVERLLQKVAAPDGLLVIGSYGNRSRGEPAAPIDAHLASLGLTVLGAAAVGAPAIARFAWVRAAA
jgi:SAM-dependent methyltransferase